MPFLPDFSISAIAISCRPSAISVEPRILSIIFPVFKKSLVPDIRWVIQGFARSLTRGVLNGKIVLDICSLLFDNFKTGG
jgi:hypothetical protein